MRQYNLTILAVDGSLYSLASSDLGQLKKFLAEYDHEGSSVSLMVKDGALFTEHEHEKVYEVLNSSPQTGS